MGSLVVFPKWAKAEVAEAHVQLRSPSFKRSLFRLCTIKMAGRYWSEDDSLLFSGHHLSHTHKEKSSVSSTLFTILTVGAVVKGSAEPQLSFLPGNAC